MRKQTNKRNLMPLLKRVLGIMLREYKVQFGLVVALILGAALATLRGTLFMRDLVDVYIKPMIGSEAPDFGPLAHALLSLALVYLIGLLCSYGYNRIMAIISQGTLKKIRIQLFSQMESLPIKYFDTTPHGDIMSVYTNDVDTLRQLIGQSVPQLVNSTVTIVITFISMVCLNIPLTILTLCMVAVMLVVASKLGGMTGTYFIQQQSSLGKVNAYIEEMMEGQKVVKVFCHENENIEQFRAINQELRESTKKVTYKKLEGDIVFDDVDFGYSDEKIVLHNIKLFAAPGQKIAFVGSTGAGKTTITNLINRFYDIQDGKIRYDGINRQ